MRKYLSILLLITSFSVPGWSETTPQQIVLNDLHSRLNPTLVASLHHPKSTYEVLTLIKQAKNQGKSISISGGQHSMGGQQSGSGTMHLNMSEMNDVLRFDRKNGIVTVEAGIQWPELIEYLISSQRYSKKQWGITQKQTGADRLSIVGALSSNIHGRGLILQPMV